MSLMKGMITPRRLLGYFSAQAKRPFKIPIPHGPGFMYLVDIMDWYTRYVMAWAVSNTLDVGFCLEALERAFSKQTPEIFNSDQGFAIYVAGLD